MKKNLTILALLLVISLMPSIQAQTLLARWTFPTGASSDSLADGGTPANLAMAIHTEGGTSAIDFSKNGLSTKSAQATGWDNGAMTKCWVVQVNTSGYETIKLSSKQQSGGNNPGPADYNVQYRIGTGGTWMDVPNSTIVTANNWSSAVLDSLALPETCKNQPSVYIRWLMKTNVSSNGGTVTSTGVDKIDDIYITGKMISTLTEEHAEITILSITQSLSDGSIRVVSAGQINTIELIDLNGKTVLTHENLNCTSVTVGSARIKKGIYLIRATTHNGQTVIKQAIIY